MAAPVAAAAAAADTVFSSFDVYGVGEAMGRVDAHAVRVCVGDGCGGGGCRCSTSAVVLDTCGALHEKPSGFSTDIPRFGLSFFATLNVRRLP